MVFSTVYYYLSSTYEIMIRTVNGGRISLVLFLIFGAISILFLFYFKRLRKLAIGFVFFFTLLWGVVNGGGRNYSGRTNFRYQRPKSSAASRRLGFCCATRWKCRRSVSFVCFRLLRELQRHAHGWARICGGLHCQPAKRLYMVSFVGCKFR